MNNVEKKKGQTELIKLCLSLAAHKDLRVVLRTKSCVEVQ